MSRNTTAGRASRRAALEDKLREELSFLAVWTAREAEAETALLAPWPRAPKWATWCGWREARTAEGAEAALREARAYKGYAEQGVRYARQALEAL